MTNEASSIPQIDLNQADWQTLSTLPGIGQKMAERIIRFREEVHPFEEAIEITAVRGISERMYRQFAGQVTVSLPPEEITAAETPEPEAISEVAEETTEPVKEVATEPEPQEEEGYIISP